jgi:L-fuconate dehydratase
MSDDVITELAVHDVRFPTSRTLAGSDALNLDPDYSATYVVVRIGEDGPSGHGLAFTNGRGNEICVTAVEALRHHVVGRSLSGIFDDLNGFWRSLVRDTQLRWLGPEKGIIHMATAAIVNAVWDLEAKRQGLPMWKLLADMPPEQLVAAVEWSYLSDALTPEQALDLLRERREGMAEREEVLRRTGLPAYTTSAGWLGYGDDHMVELARGALDEGFTHLKMKVGGDPDDDLRRARLLREVIGPDNTLMMDANQRWDVGEAITRMRGLAEVRPWWIEEPTNPDDVLGHARIAEAIDPIVVATGENAHNRVMFKQLLQAGGMGIVQIDACRVAGVNEVLGVLLLAAAFDKPVCPHAGGVGLCEYVQHLAAFDYLCLSGTQEGRLVEYVDHLHEHFVDPVVAEGGRYRTPLEPGYSVELHPESITRYSFPHGAEWTTS